MEIYLVRHTETVAEKGICYGQTDLDIKSPFVNEFNKIKLKFPDEDYLVYTSPLIRCIKLAEYFSPNKYIIDSFLQELNFGDWENKAWYNIPEQELTTWMNDFVNQCPPKGESFIELHTRVQLFIEEKLLKNTGKSKVLIITHAGVIRSFLCHILNLPLKNSFKISIEFGSVTHIELNENSDRNKLIFLNK